VTDLDELRIKFRDDLDIDCNLYETISKLIERCEKAENEIAKISKAMPNDNRYLDPPDGGGVAIHVQVERMAEQVYSYSELLSAYNNLIKQQEWQPIDTAPKDGTDILLLCKLNHNKGKVHIGAYHYEDRHWWNHSGTFVSSPSFWMPLLLPPITK